MVVRLDGGSPTNSIPDRVLAHGLDYCRALGIITSWEMVKTGRRAYRPKRRYLVTFANGTTSELAAGAVAAYVAGVHDTMSRAVESIREGES